MAKKIIRLTEEKLREKIKDIIINEMLNNKFINEAYYPKSKRNDNIDHMDNLFMTPNDEFDNETGKWSENNFPLPEKASYSNLIGWYNDFCSNFIDAYNTEDEHWTFIYQSGEIINQDGDNGKTVVGDRWNKRIEKRNEKILPQEEKFKPVQRRNISAIIYSNGDGEWYWYKDNYGKELLIDYTGWNFEELGDDWL